MAGIFAPTLQTDVRPEQPVADSSLGNALGAVAKGLSLFNQKPRAPSATESRGEGVSLFSSKIEELAAAREQGNWKVASSLERDAIRIATTYGLNREFTNDLSISRLGVDLIEAGESDEQILWNEFKGSDEGRMYINAAMGDPRLKDATEEEKFNHAFNAWYKVTQFEPVVDSLQLADSKQSMSILNSKWAVENASITAELSQDANFLVEENISAIVAARINEIQALVPANTPEQESFRQSQIEAVKAQATAWMGAANTREQADKDASIAALMNLANNVPPGEDAEDLKALYYAVAESLRTGNARTPNGVMDQLLVKNVVGLQFYEKQGPVVMAAIQRAVSETKQQRMERLSQYGFPGSGKANESITNNPTPNDILSEGPISIQLGGNITYDRIPTALQATRSFMNSELNLSTPHGEANTAKFTRGAVLTWALMGEVLNKGDTFELGLVQKAFPIQTERKIRELHEGGYVDHAKQLADVASNTLNLYAGSVWTDKINRNVIQGLSISRDGNKLVAKMDVEGLGQYTKEAIDKGVLRHDEVVLDLLANYEGDMYGAFANAAINNFADLKPQSVERIRLAMGSSFMDKVAGIANGVSEYNYAMERRSAINGYTGEIKDTPLETSPLEPIPEEPAAVLEESRIEGPPTLSPEDFGVRREDMPGFNEPRIGGNSVQTSLPQDESSISTGSPNTVSQIPSEGLIQQELSPVNEQEVGQMFTKQDLEATLGTDSIRSASYRDRKKFSLAVDARLPAYNQDVEFIDAVYNLAEELNTDPNNIWKAIGFETGGTFSPAEPSRASSGTGLIQFMPRTAEDLGTSVEDLAVMTRPEQMEVVSKFLKQKLRNVENPTLTDVYLAILWPRAVGKGEDYVIWKDDPNRKRGDPYDSNIGLDTDEDGKVKKAEVIEFVEAKTKGYTIPARS